MAGELEFSARSNFESPSSWPEILPWESFRPSPSHPSLSHLSRPRMGSFRPVARRGRRRRTRKVERRNLRAAQFGERGVTRTADCGLGAPSPWFVPCGQGAPLLRCAPLVSPSETKQRSEGAPLLSTLLRCSVRRRGRGKGSQEWDAAVLAPRSCSRCRMSPCRFKCAVF